MAQILVVDDLPANRALVVTLVGHSGHQALEAPTAYGVMGMRERARQLGGQLSITSEPGQGSCLQLQIPLELS